MARCEIIGTDYAARISYTVTQNVEKNRSAVKVTKVELRSLKDAGFPAYIVGSITVNGVKTTTLELTDTKSCGISALSKEYAGGGESSWSGFSSKGVTVYHDDDGTATIPIKANLSVYMARGTTAVEIGSAINKTVKVSLPTIPRVSGITAAAVELGQAMSISITRAASSFRDTVSWSCGELSGTIAEKTAETSLSWTVPMELANQEPNKTRASITLMVTTYQGSTEIGTRVLMMSCGIPETIVPTLTVSVADKLGYADTYGGYIQSQSQAKVTTSASGSYGSTIKRIEVSCGKLTGTGEEVSFALEDSGQVAISVTATDSRGRTASAQAEITVLPYQKPHVAITDSYRCDESGNRKPDGEWMKLVCDAGATAITGNKLFVTAAFVDMETKDQRIHVRTYGNRVEVTGQEFKLEAGLDKAYECQISARDNFCKVYGDSVLISVAFALMDFCRETKAVGIGMRAKTAEKLSIGLNTDMNEHGIENLLEPVNSQDAATKAYVDGKYQELLQMIQSLKGG